LDHHQKKIESPRRTQREQVKLYGKEIGYGRRPGHRGGKPSDVANNDLARKFDVAHAYQVYQFFARILPSDVFEKDEGPAM